MPKKTKKEKVLAEKRRQASPTTPHLGAIADSTKLTSPSYRFAPVATPSQNTTGKKYSNDLHRIRFDLMKTLVFASIGFTIEIGLFVLEKNNVIRL